MNSIFQNIQLEDQSFIKTNIPFIELNKILILNMSCENDGCFIFSQNSISFNISESNFTKSNS